MSSVKDTKQRAAARARLEREMEARREAASRKRRNQARIGGGIAAVVVLGAVIWIIAAATGGGSNPAAGPSNCTWLSDVPSPDPSATSPAPLPSGMQEVGTPPTDPPHSGFQVLTFDVSLATGKTGTIQVEMDYSKTPCTAASLSYLASKQYYDKSSCHRLVPDIYALQCGDPSGTGSGGTTYRFADENLQPNKLPAYHEGDVAMANTGQEASNGTQFFFVYGNSQLDGKYSLWGHVIAGMDIIKEVAAGGDDERYAQQAGGGAPITGITFTKVTAGPITPTSQASPSPSPSASTSASASPSPSAS